jgi:hypothetical protein
MTRFCRGRCSWLPLLSGPPLLLPILSGPLLPAPSCVGAAVEWSRFCRGRSVLAHASVGAAAVAPDRAGSSPSSLSLLSGPWARSRQTSIGKGCLQGAELLRSASQTPPVNDGAALLPPLLHPGQQKRSRRSRSSIPARTWNASKGEWE